MTIIQKVEHLREDRYLNDIVITEVPKGYFPVIISNRIIDDADNREIEIVLLPMEQSPGGKMDCGSGRFQRREHEKGINVKLSKDGNILANSCYAYDSDY